MQRPSIYAWIGNPIPFWKAFSVEFNHITAKRFSTTRQDYLVGQAKTTSKPTKRDNRRSRNTAISSHETSSATAVLKGGRSPKVDPDPPKVAYARSFLFEETRRPAAKRQQRVKDPHLKDIHLRDLTRFEKDLASNPFGILFRSTRSGTKKKE